MAGNEGSVGGQTELLTGWSCVVHRPSEDPEPSSLPSTVDITAFSSSPNVQSSQNLQNDCCSNSDSDTVSDSENSFSDASGSCSYSSSDSDSSTSSQASSASSVPPHFSVTSSETGGLRLTIATVRKDEAAETVSNNKLLSDDEHIKNLPIPKLSSSDSDSECSDSDCSRGKSDPEKKLIDMKTRTKYVRKVNMKTTNNKQTELKTENMKRVTKQKETNTKSVTRVAQTRGRSQHRANKINNLALPKIPSSQSSTSDTDSSASESNSVMLASCCLQEIRQEDLAAILPDQQECDAFGGFECETRTEKVDVGDGSGSDMELPTQLVNAAIQRVTTESSSETDSQPATYASTLLQQFVQQTQLLNNSFGGSTNASHADSTNKQSSLGGNADALKNGTNFNKNATKKKRGRPRKVASKKGNRISKVQDNILNSEYCGESNVSPDSGIQNSPIHVSSPEHTSSNIKTKNESIKLIEGSNDRSKKSQKISANNSIKSKNPLIKREIVKHRVEQKHKMALTCNNLDRVLYANTDRILYPPRRKVGRPAGKISIRKPGRPPKHKHNSEDEHITNESSSKVSRNTKDSSKNMHKSEHRKNKKMTSSDNDIVQLTSNTLSLSLGRSDLKETSNQNKTNSVPKKHSNKKINSNNDGDIKSQSVGLVKNNTKSNTLKPKLPCIKHMKVMHTKHCMKNKKHKIKILRTVASHSIPIATIDPDIDTLICDFIKYCNLGTNKMQKENLPEIFRCVKRFSKKRKGAESSDHRKKKKQSHINNSGNKDANCNEQRLPLKKRHYHISSNNENKSSLTNNAPSAGFSDGFKENFAVKQQCDNKDTKSSLKSLKQNSNNEMKHDSGSKIVLVNKSQVNNNIYNFRKNIDTEDLIGVHIDEAIEACITKYTSSHKSTSNSSKHSEISDSNSLNDLKSASNITATTPKKRHRLETEILNTNEVRRKLDSLRNANSNEDGIEDKPKLSLLESVVTELKNKKTLLSKTSECDSNCNKVIDKKSETIAQMITRKKNRLEDLTSNLVSKKTNTDVDNQRKLKKHDNDINSDSLHRVSVIKSPIAKKIKPSNNDKILDSIVDEKPTGIFLQTVDLELHIPATTIQMIQGNNTEESSNNLLLSEKKLPLLHVGQSNEKETINKSEVKQENVPVKKKARRRKAINRTGFPTIKKKKKKVIPNKVEVKTTESTENENNIYDRVPRIDEEASTFIKRTQNSTLSVVALENLQVKNENNNGNGGNIDSDVSKWEVSSECESLPLDEYEFESVKSMKSERSSSRLEMKLDRFNFGLRDVSPATSVETRFSDKVRNKSRDLTPDKKQIDASYELSKRSKRKRENSSDKLENKQKKITDELRGSQLNLKRLTRDISPASSIETFDSKPRSHSVTSSSGDDTKRFKKIPRWRKKYLVAGLFSDYYKEDDEIMRARRESTSLKTKLVYNPADHPYGLLPPPYHCGKYLRCRKVPFKLPYDLWWQHMHSQLPGRDLVPSWNYRKIRTNVYCVRVPSGACEPQACNCTASSGCEDDCINRLVLAECPSTHKCRNQRIQKHEWAPGLEKFMTENKGWGVRTKMSIKTGEFILEYVGEVVSDQEFKQRMATRYVNDTHHYCLHLDGGLVIDGHRMGGDGRFVNHSCQPNCEMQKWSVNGQFRMALFALRDIQPGEELTYDYNFSLFNAAEGQVCKCESDNCRGVIGGKSQRVRQSIVNNHLTLESSNQIGRVGRPRKNRARRATSGTKEIPPTGNNLLPVGSISITPQVKPMSYQQKYFALQHHCFLLRNLDKVKRMRERLVSTVSRNHPQVNAAENTSMFLSQLNALRQPRNIRTRRVAQVEENPELNKAARLASLLRDLFELVVTAKDENQDLLSTPFLTLPSKRKFPEYFQRISNPIDFNTIEQNIAMGVYRTVDTFDKDMIQLFMNSVRFFGRTSEMGIAATRLRKVYNQAKLNCLEKLEDVLGEKAPPNFIPTKDPVDEEDVIRCICGLYRDEGLMIQCERCLVWQHCECVRADPDAASYHCERCVPRTVDYEIPLDEFTEEGHRYYVSLMRGNLQLRQGDTVYVLRDIPIPGTDKKHTYDTIGDVKYTDLDIFRIERLWKDSKTGQRFAFGHHYLRPHETYHEPTRKFFPNEVMRVPLYEVVPVELIMSPCWVLDVNTYCKGRPLGASEDHVYICEYRVDKSARLFSKISKSKFPVCTKSYAFERFDVRLKISRTFTPHELTTSQVKPRGRKPNDSEETLSSIKEIPPTVIDPLPVLRSRDEQRAHLNNILLRLLGRLPSKQALDVSYLLEGGRRRKKIQNS